MDKEQLDIQIKLLLDILNKKLTILQEILSITENQSTILKSIPHNREMFLCMFDEKQNRINDISAGDDIFNRLFETVIQEIRTNAGLYKSYVADMQKLVKEIMDMEIRIKLEEHNNRKYIQTVINPVPRNVAIQHYVKQKNNKLKI